MVVRIAVLAALAAGTLPAVVGQAHAAEALGLREVLRYVEAASPELASAAQLRLGAEAETRTARAWPNPDLDVGGGSWRSRVGGAMGSTSTVGISQLIELPSVRSARADVSEAGLSAASAQVESVRLAVGYQARAAFFEMLRRQEEERLAMESVKLLAEIRGKVQTRVEVGEAPRFELVRAESESLAAQNAAAAAALRVDEARAVLRRLGGNALPSVFVARGTLPPPPEAPPLSTLVPQVLAAHPQLKVASAEAERARSRLELERSLRNPQPTLRAISSSDPESSQAMVGHLDPAADLEPARGPDRAGAGYDRLRHRAGRGTARAAAARTRFGLCAPGRVAPPDLHFRERPVAHRRGGPVRGGGGLPGRRAQLPRSARRAADIAQRARRLQPGALRPQRGLDGHRTTHRAGPLPRDRLNNGTGRP